MRPKIKSGTGLRQAFLDYFSEQGHQVVPSSPLVPGDDPTLLFTNAGMVQFKRAFLGEEELPYRRAVSVQKCLRASGKHNDLEEVGRTPRHHTFFEMLGNFSFGDYFKEEAIRLAWEFSTEVMSLPQDCLWISVHEEDDEAAKLWERVGGVDPERIIRCGDEENFWAMGETGPCGPCSELFYDQGGAVGCGEEACGPNCACGRFLEFWNLVFMQFERGEAGNLTLLAHPSIDTGMGLERTASILQGERSNFATDLFRPLMSLLEDLLNQPCVDSDGEEKVPFRVLADHGRAVAFLLADGVYPSNEGRGYVLRRILRRGVRHYWMAGKNEPLLYRVAGRVTEVMGEAYPELADRRDHIERACRAEEERFLQTIEQGMEIFQGILEEVQAEEGEIIPGEEAFRLYDTYGFPLDLTELIAKEEGLTVDREGFEQAMAGQRERSRREARFGQEGELTGDWTVLREGTSRFVGYDRLEMETEVLRYRSSDKRVQVIVAESPFYGEAGGQVGDTGWVEVDGLRLLVEDTQLLGAEPVLIAGVGEGDVSKLGRVNRVSTRVDGERRMDIRRNHTATHLLHAALRKVLGDHVRQAGSLVAPDRLRFDFSHPQPVTVEEVKAIEDLVNEEILADKEVRVAFEVFKEARARGAMALFGEKYGDEVRTIEIPGFSLELCGGTHCDATGQIGLFVITSESGVSAGVRRIEAITGWWTVRLSQEERAVRRGLSERLGVPPDDVEAAVDRLREENKRLAAERQRWRREIAAREAEQLEPEHIGPEKLFSEVLDSSDELMSYADALAERWTSGMAVFTAPGKNNAELLIRAYSEPRGWKLVAAASERLGEEIGFKGGGRGNLARGIVEGEKDPHRALEGALVVVRQLLKEFGDPDDQD